MYKPFLFQVIRFLAVIVAVLGIYFFAIYTSDFLFPVLFAILLSFLINPIVSFFENKLKFPRPVASAAVILALFGFIMGIIVFIMTELIQGTAYLAEILPKQVQILTGAVEEFFNSKLVPLYHKTVDFFHSLDPAQQSAITDNIQEILDNISILAVDLLHRLLSAIPAILSSLPNSVAVVIFIVLAAFFITNDWQALSKSVKKGIPASVSPSIKRALEQLKKAVSGFIKAQFLLLSITTCIVYIGLLIFKIEHALTIAIIAAAVDLLPYIGTGVIFIPWIIYLFITANYSMTISLIVLYMLIVILRQILEPKILSSHIGLNPLAALLSLFAGVQFWGVPGLIIAPLLLILFTALHQAGILTQLWQFIRG